MVLAFPVGKPRPFWRGFGLAVATVSVYGFYWDFKTHMELYHQFELKREHREDGAVWYIMGFLLPVLRFVYYYHFSANLAYLQTRMRHARRVSPGTVVTLMIAATSSLFLLPFVGSIIASVGFEADASSMVVLGFTIIAIGVALWVVLKAVAYHLLQRNINRVWASFHQRLAQLKAVEAPPATAPTGGERPAA